MREEIGDLIVPGAGGEAPADLPAEPAGDANGIPVQAGENFLMFGWSKLTAEQRQVCDELPILVRDIAQLLNERLLTSEPGYRFFVGYRIADPESDEPLDAHNRFEITLRTDPRAPVRHEVFATDVMLSPRGLPNMLVLQRVRSIVQWLADHTTRFPANSHSVFVATAHQNIAEYMHDLDPRNAGHRQKMAALLRGVNHAASELVDPGPHLAEALMVGKTPNTLSTFGAAVVADASFDLMISNLPGGVIAGATAEPVAASEAATI